MTTLYPLLLIISASAGGATTLDEALARIVDTQAGLKVDEVAERTATTSPKLGKSRADAEVAAKNLDRALAAYLPSTQLKMKYARLSHVDAQPPFTSLQNSTSIQSSILVPLSDYALRISQSYAAASKQERAAVLQAMATELSVKSDSRLAYYEWARSRLQVIVTAQAVEQSKQHLSDAIAAFDAGTASRADVARVEAQVAATEQVHVEAQNLVQVLDERLRTLMHDDRAEPYTLGENLLVDPPSQGAVETLAALLEEAKQSRLELRVIGANLDALHSSTQALRAGYFPRLDGFAETTIANPNSRYFPAEDKFERSWSAGFELSWSPSAIPAVSADVSANLARAAGIEAQAAELTDAIRLEITEAKEAIEAARSAIATRARGLVAAEEAYRVRLELFRSGRATSVELTDAETELTRAGLDAINAHIDLRVALVRFEHATGRDVHQTSNES